MPHLIVVPGTLVSQWEQELKVAFQPNYVDILVYGAGLAQHEYFWSDTGPYKQAKHSASSRIILASHSVSVVTRLVRASNQTYQALQQDYGLLYTPQKKPKDLPWAHPARSISYNKNVHKTLFSQEYLSVVFDEAQTIRNCGPRQSSALLILEQCSVRLILTATPLQTSTKVRD